jgi:hypothetical protein
MREEATDAAIGEERILVSGAGREPRGSRSRYQRIDLMFRTQRFVAGVSAEKYAGLPNEPALVEALAARQLVRIEEVLAVGGPGLGGRTLRLAIAGENAIWDAYNVRDGEPLREFNEAPDAFEERRASVTEAGMVDQYRLEQQFLGLFGSSERPLAFYIARLATFTDEDAASAYLAAAADRLAQGNIEDLRPVDDVPAIGDETAAFAYRHTRADGVTFDDYRIYVRMGSEFFTIALGTTEALDPGAVNDLAEKQAACLRGSDCSNPIPVPPALGGSTWRR